MNENKTLIYGIGNEILSDDAIGPKLTWQLEKDLNLPNIKYETAFVGGLEVLEIINGYNTVVFIDGIKTKNGIPGDVYYFTTEDFKETLNLSNLHDTDFLTAIELGKQIGFQIPPNIHIIAIEIVEDGIYSNDFTPEIQKRYDEFYGEIREFVVLVADGKKLVV